MRAVQILGAAAVGSLLLSCYNPGVYVPPELASVTRLEVKGRGGWHAAERLTFGEYQTVRRHQVGAALRTVVQLAGASVEEPIEFVLRAREQDLVTVRCGSVERPEHPGVWSTGQRLSCALRPVGGDSATEWRLTVRTDPYEVPSGDLVGPASRLQVVGSVQDPEGQVLLDARPLGYYVRDGRRALAAVEVLGGGAAWMDAALSPGQRDLIAGALAALIIWDGLLR